MAAFEVIALDTVTPQLRAPGAADTYTFPRAVSMSGALTYGGVTLNNAVTGTGNMVLSVSPTFTTPVLGTPSSGTLTNCTGLPLSTGVTGTLPVANGGTGQTSYTDGQLLIGNSTGGTLAKATLTAGANVTITNGPGSITIAASGGGGGSSTLTISNKTAAYTVVAGDLGTIINCTSGTFTVSLTAAATLGSGFNCWVWNTGTGVITIDPSGAETIDGVSTLTLRQGEGSQIVCNGTNWETGDKKAMRAYAENTVANASRPVASSSYSVAIGHNSSGSGSQTATSAGAISVGGSYASGTDSFAAAIADNTSSYGARSVGAVSIGNVASSSSAYAIAIGQNSDASNSYAIAIGGYTSASGTAAVSLGNGSRAREFGKFAYCGYSGFGYGVAQIGTIILVGATTDNTPKVLTSQTSAAGTTNQLILQNNSAYAFTGTVVARRQAAGGTESAAWKIEGLIRREGTAGSTALVASTVTVISNAPGWTLALSADTTNGGLSVTATGAVATNIRWLATVDSSEITYA